MNKVKGIIGLMFEGRGDEMIKREMYMKQIRPFIDRQIIKVITGIRRCGKSVILKLIQAELIEQGVKPHQIMTINFEDLSNVKYMTAESLHQYIMDIYKENHELRYLFFDEIQEVEEWERCINSLLSKENFDLYITGSNAKLLSGELATYLSGRYIEIHVYPFSFSEFLMMGNKRDNQTCDRSS